MKKTLLLAMVAAAVAVMLTVPALVNAKRPNANLAASSVSIMQSDPHLGDWVTFSFSVPSTVRYPRVEIRCSQNGELVYAEAGPANQEYLLGSGSSTWKSIGGEADCTVTVYEWDWHPQQTFHPYATSSFHAGAAR